MANGLIDFGAFNPGAAFTSGLSAGSNLVRGIQQSAAQREERDRQEQARQLLGQSTGSALAGLSPEMFAQEQQILADQEAAEQAENERMLLSAARDARTALDIKDPLQRDQFLLQRATRIRDEGGDPSDTLQLRELPFDQQNFELQDVVNQVSSASQLVDKPAGAIQKQKGESGLVFDPSSGTFSVDPVAKAHLESLNQKAVIPPQLLTGLSQEVATKADAAYTAAGGGKDGMSAYEKVIGSASEGEKRLASPQILKTSFPKATDAELAQLQGTMDAAKTTESGLKAAGMLRADQRRDKKAQVFQDRAVTLLTGILESDQLGDVLGSIEGNIDFRLSDSEAELITDITEAQNILTAQNMDLMSGVLSESDIALLKNLASGATNRGRSEKRFRADVQKLVDKLSGAKIQTADDLQQARSANAIQSLSDQDLDAQIQAAEARGEL